MPLSKADQNEIKRLKAKNEKLFKEIRQGITKIKKLDKKIERQKTALRKKGYKY